MAEVNQHLIKSFQRSLMFIGIGILILVATNLYNSYSNSITADRSYTAVIVANESSTKAEKALQQAMINTRELIEHEGLVGYHSNDTKINGEAILNNTILLLKLHEKIP